MATIVQPYNPWREQLAANFIGPLLGNMIQRSQEAETNRKRNAMLAAWTDPGAVQDLLAKQDFTLGFDSDLRPWANSLVNNNALPQMNMTAAAVPVQNSAVPTLTSLFQLGGTKRFGGVNMDTVMPFAKELLAEQEAQRQRGLATQRQADIKQYADKLSGIEGDEPFARAMAEGVIRGYYDHDIFKDWSNYVMSGKQLANAKYKNEADFLLGREQNEIDRYKANSQNAHYERSDALGRDTLEQEQLYKMLDFKHRQMIDNWKLEHPKQELDLVDTGDGIQGIAWDGFNGKSTILFYTKKGMSPKDAADVKNAAEQTQIDRDRLAETGRHNRAEEANAAAAAQNKGAVSPKDRYEARNAAIIKLLTNIENKRKVIQDDYKMSHDEKQSQLAQLDSEEQNLRKELDELTQSTGQGQSGAGVLQAGVLFPGDVPPDVTDEEAMKIISSDKSVAAQPIKSSVFPEDMIFNPAQHAGMDEQLQLDETEARRMLDYAEAGKYADSLGIHNREEMLERMRQTGYKIVMNG